MDAILSRRSVRRYTPESVSQECVERLLAAGMAAPSAGDERPWHFVVIRDATTRNCIPNIHPYAHMVSEAPVALLVCGDLNLQKHHGFWVQDCAAATENVLVEAHHLGLGAVWLGVYPVPGRVEGLRRLLEVPEHVVPFALVALGHPAEHKGPGERFDPTRIHHDRW